MAIAINKCRPRVVDVDAVAVAVVAAAVVVFGLKSRERVDPSSKFCTGFPSSRWQSCKASMVLNI
jgi:hypothetical protein